VLEQCELLLPTYTNAGRRKQWRHHCNTLLDGQLVCMCFSGERPSAFLIPAPSSREMFAMQIECMLSAKAHTHTHVDAFTAAGMFLSCCKIISSIPVLILARVHFTMQIETATTTWNRSTFKVEPLLASAFFTRRALLSWQSCWNF